ncbi:MAG: 2-succinyl-5-enolpyruvyl-6-hydroxy-3-cyclohexene-1-carboxylic-acid synthase [Chloroflexota bacterium]
MSVNAALLWAQVLVDELARGGLRRVVIAPGSRSTPLTLAFTAHEKMHCTLQLDERSAAFFALGLTLAGGEPAALVCTSGTAAAEFFPAIIEASQSDVPLLVLTADRPPELRDSGANQTIDQIKLYGGYARWQADLPVPETDPTPATLRYLRACAARALAAARGLSSPPGPVHLNLPFRKPLEPHDRLEWQATIQAAASHARPPHTPWTQIGRGLRLPSDAQIDRLAGVLKGRARGLIVAGPRTPGGNLPAALLRLAQAGGYPLLADPLSGMRFGLAETRPVIAGYALGLASGLSEQLPQPEAVLRFGAPPTANALLGYLEALPAETPQVAIQADGRWQDGAHTLSHLLAVDEAQCCEALAARLHAASPDAGWLASWRALDARVQAELDTAPLCEGMLVRALFDALPSRANVVLANSLPLRHVDEFVPASAKGLRLFGCRGASGIDGAVSTALGVAASSERPTLFLTGDLSFYHDQNGLFALKKQGIKITIVLINNDGGGIFRRLPVSRFEPPFHEWFITPHGLDFSPTAQQYGLAYRRCEPQDAPAALADAVAAAAPQLLEVRTDSAQSQAVRQQIIQALQLT